MGDFYSDMSMSGAWDVPLPENVPVMVPQFDTISNTNVGLLQTYFPTFFVEGIVPTNIRYMPAYTLGSAANSQMPNLDDKILTPFNNLESALEYLETSQSDVQFRDRFFEVAEDKATINSMCQFGGDLGAYSAGALANKKADGYTDKAIETILTLNDQEKLNLRMFKQVAAEKGVDPETIRGTGITREFVPEFQKGDLCDRPERGERPKSFGFGNDNTDFGDSSSNSKNNNSGPPTGGSSGGDILNSDLADDSNLPRFNERSESTDSTNGSENNGSIFGRFFGFGSSESSQCLESDIPLTNSNGTSSGENGETLSKKAYDWLEA